MTFYDKVAERVNGAVIKQLENGIIPWRMPWQDMSGAVNGITMKPYKGVNQLLLGSHESPSGIFLTFQQALDLGGNVRKGSKSELVVFWKMMGQERDEKGFVTERGRPMIKTANVFSLEQCENIPDEKRPQKPELQLTIFEPLELAEQLIAGIKPTPRVRIASQASYSPSEDLLRMPDMFLFESIQAYYHTYFHELGHWTGHATRLDRFGAKKKSYAYEELVAEMCAAFLCVHARIDPVDEKDDLEQRAAYIVSWMRKLKNDPKILIEATGKGQKAAEFIIGKVVADTEIVTLEQQRTAA